MAGWFVVNVADAEAVRHPRGGSTVRFEPRERRFADYPVDEVADRHGASVATATSDPAEAYAPWGRDFEPTRLDWPPA